MKRFANATCVVAVLFCIGAITIAQGSQIVIQVVDGRNGNPLANQHLLVSAGQSQEYVSHQGKQFDLVTNNQGLADLTIATRDLQWIQVWVDWHVLCQSEPNSKSFSVAQILSTGLSTPNTCGAVTKKAVAGHFVVFARPMHFWEKMRE